MAAIARPLDEEAVSRWDGDGGSQPAPATAAVRPDVNQFLRDMRLDDVAEARDGDVSFPLGILWPYTADLRRVRAEYDAALGSPTGELLAALATLHGRIAFAPGGAGRAVADVYNDVKDALGGWRADNVATRVCSRCRKEFPLPEDARPTPPGEWWLCPPCHDRLIGSGSRASS